MLFNSHLFIFVFLPLFLLGWHTLNKIKKYFAARIFLILMSCVFYAYAGVSYLTVLLISSVIGFFFAKGTAYLHRGRKACFICGTVFHLGLLGYFKYTNFFLQNINTIFSLGIPLMQIMLPVGISFYTFKQLAYLADSYIEEKASDSFLDYLVFMIYFPQILQGPIMLRSEFMPQQQLLFLPSKDSERVTFNLQLFAEGVCHFFIGLAKKVLLADTLAIPVNYGYENIASLDGVSALFLAVGYMTELYFDFSGYCDMAVGIGKMTGLEVPENFDAPFHASSVREFWKRWNMTLSRFFTVYVYFPLGGSRRGKIRTLINVMIVMLLSGLWHGADYSFVLWGFLFGLAMVFEHIAEYALHPGYTKDSEENKQASGKTDTAPTVSSQEKQPRSENPSTVHSGMQVLRKILTFLYVSLVFVFFRADSIADGLNVIGKIFTSAPWSGFFLTMASQLEMSEVYAADKFLSMSFSAALPYFRLFMLILLCAACLWFILGKETKKRVACASSSGRMFKMPYALVMGVIATWSLISITGVSEYLYFTF